METQAQAPAPAQAQQPVHPVHEETATLNALTDWVRNTPDNDPHKGTDLEAPQAPESQQEPEAKPAEPEQQTEEVAVEFDEETPFFDLEYNGESRKLSAKEIREGYLAKQDYHRNIQKVAKEREEVQNLSRQAELRAQQEYVQRLDLHKQAVQRLANVKSMQEIEALAKEDPAAAQQEFLRVINVNQTFQAIEAEQRQAAQKLHEQQQAAMQAAIQESRSTLERDIKGWNGDVYQKVLESVTKDYGFEPKDVASVYDSRLIKVFHDAYQYRQLQRAKPEVSKRVVSVPKVVKPGSGEKPNPAKEQAEKSYERLKKTGRMEDAVTAYLSRKQK